MNPSRQPPWASLWMALFGVLGLWVIGRTMVGPHKIIGGAGVEKHGPALLLLALILPAAALELKGRATGAGPFVSALTMLKRARWAWWLFGSVAVVNMVGLLPDYEWNRRYARTLLGSGDELLPSQYTRSGDGLFGILMAHGTPPGRYLELRLPDDLSTAVPQSLARIYPDLGLLTTGGPGVAVSVVFLLLCLPLRVHLARLAGDPKYARDAVLLARVLYFAAGAAPAGIAVRWYNYRMMEQWIASDRTSVLPPSVGMVVANWAWWALVTLVISPLLLGGLIGSLRRSGEGRRVTTGSFVRDAVGSYRALAALGFIVVGGTFAVNRLAWPLLAALSVGAWFGLATSALNPLLMLVPYVVVVESRGALDGIRRGVGFWRSHPLDLLVFTAFGVTLLSIPPVLTNMLHEWPAPVSPWRTVAATAGVLDVFAAALVTAAVAELHARVRSREASGVGE